MPLVWQRVLAFATAGYTLFAAVIAGETLARQNPLTAPLWANSLAALGAVMFVAAAARIVLALAGAPRSGTPWPSR